MPGAPCRLGRGRAASLEEPVGPHGGEGSLCGEGSGAGAQDESDTLVGTLPERLRGPQGRRWRTTKAVPHPGGKYATKNGGSYKGTVRWP